MDLSHVGASHAATTDNASTADRPATERVPEILELLYSREAELVGVLLDALAGCDPEELRRLFAGPPDAPADAPAPQAEPSVPTKTVLPGPNGVMWAFPPSESTTAKPGGPRWDSAGYLIGSTPSSPHQRQGLPRGTHWSR
jgi:hypothetical protein